MATATTGASLTAVTVSTNVSEAVRVPSVADTVRLTVPAKLSGGVPENVRVAAVNVSQPGSAAPPPSVAL